MKPWIAYKTEFQKFASGNEASNTAIDTCHIVDLLSGRNFENRKKKSCHGFWDIHVEV